MMRKIFLIILICIICFSFSNDLQKKTIRDKDFKIACYVSTKKVNNYNINKIYYWFKSGEIHESMSSAGGFVLHKGYSKYYRSNQLVEQGEFNYGLKTGLWKTWYESGKLSISEQWLNGYRNGSYKVYDSLGQLITKGEYKNNLKNGYWIDHIKKDTIYYNNNFELEEKPKNVIQRLFVKKDSLEKVRIAAKKILIRKKDSIRRAKIKLERQNKKQLDSIEKANIKAEKLTKKQMDSINRK